MWMMSTVRMRRSGVVRLSALVHPQPGRSDVALAADAVPRRGTYAPGVSEKASRRPWGYFVVPAALAVAGTLEYAFEDLHAARLLSLGCLYAAIAALLLRRRFPFAAPLAALAVFGAESFISPEAVSGPVTVLFLGFYCFFVLAAGNEEPWAAAGLIAGLAITAVAEINTPGAAVVWQLFLPALMLAGWASGLVYARRGREARRLERRGEQLATEYAAESAHALADERARIAREIHDIVAHNVSVIVLQARGGRRALQRSPDEARQAFDSIESAGQQALVELRRLLGIAGAEQQAPALAPQPGLRNLDALVQGVRGAGLPVAVRIEGHPVDLPPGVDLAAYRVIQEGLTNSLKHAGDARATVVVRYTGTAVELELGDDGPGTSGTNGGSGAGRA
jgi:signal transduction histidine kinase